MLSPETFRHEALLYSGEDEFLTGTVPFVRAGVEAEEPMLIAVTAANTRALKAELNGEGEAICFLDMKELGRNPARIIPAWLDFVADHGGNERAVRGIGEPIWPGRSPAELVECQRHEWLLNVAFGPAPAWWLLCPYDAERLDGDVLEAAHLTHPYVAVCGERRSSRAYRDPEVVSDPFASPLPPAGGQTQERAFAIDNLGDIRRFVATWAESAGLDARRTGDLVLAVSELATNSIRHGGGHGTVTVWQEGSTLLCEIRDSGRLDDALAGRRRPDASQLSGRGLWLSNQLCDLVQIRSLPEGNVIRVHMGLG